MGIQLFANNAVGALAASISSTSTSLTLQSGQGALFPVIPGGSGDWFALTLTTAGQNPSSSSEIVKVTATSTDTFTIARAQESTSAKAWNAGDQVENLDTAGSMANLVQPAQAQAAGFNYAIDTGSANAYIVSLTPTVGDTVGMPVRFKAGHGNTGTSTLNLSGSAQALELPGGTALPNDVIVANAIYTAVWTGSYYELQGAADGLLTAPGSVVANFLVRYDNNGYVFANYINQPSSNNENPSVSQVIVTNGSDSYFRKTGLANFAEQLFATVVTGSLGQNGYMLVPLGGTNWILQWGYHTGANAGAGLETISLNISMPAQLLVALAQSVRNSTGSVGTGYTINYTLTTFDAVLDRSTTDTFRDGWWIAIGK